jgi:hypothetical protein
MQAIKKFQKTVGQKIIMVNLSSGELLLSFVFTGNQFYFVFTARALKKETLKIYALYFSILFFNLRGKD